MSRAPRLLAVRVSAGSAAPPEVFPNEVLADLLELAYRRERKKPASVDVLFADDQVMSRLNRRHLGLNEPTDVLSFEDGETDEEGRLRLGDIAVGAETARRAAAERGVAAAEETAFCALHGLLHLLGWRDDEAAERNSMLAEQYRVMREYGLDVSEDILPAAGEETLG